MKKNKPLLADVRAPWDVPESKWSVFVPRRFWRTILLPAVFASGLLLAVLEWLTVHPSVSAWVFIVGLLILEIVVINFFFNRSEKREAPGVAVVAIETLRSANKPIPRL